VLRRFALTPIILLFTCSPLFADESWVSVGSDGHLVYHADERGNQIPDFSNCGYHGGGVALPNDVPVKATLHPQSAGDDGARIQAALDEIGTLSPDSRGIRGALLLTKGMYRIAGSVQVIHSGIVLRGEGEGEDGTILIATGKSRRALVQLGGAHVQENEEAEPAGSPGSEKDGHWHKISDAYVPVGSHVVTLDDVSGLQVGDNVIVRRPSTENWIHVLGMDQIPPRKNGGKVIQWKAGSKDLNFDRIITTIHDKRVTLDAPLANALDSIYGGGELSINPKPPGIREVAVENLRGQSEYSGETDEEHSWSFLAFTGVQDGYVRHVTSLHFANNLVVLSGASKWITVQDCTCLDPISQITGGRRYSFAMNNCQLCLVQRCTGRNGRHDFVMGACVPGPNVFFDCRADHTHADSGPHHRWSVGTLYDNIDLPDGELNIRNRGNLGTGHGWAGANQVCWNCVVKKMIVENPPTAQNWAIGCKVKDRTGNGIWVSVDRPLAPKSLYLAQLKDRLGAAAVANITSGASLPPN
jgi:hypothetical protein